MRKLVFLALSGLVLLMSAGAQEQNLILRRVYISPLQIQGSALGVIFTEIPASLHARLTSLEPIVRVTSREEAHSLILSTAEPAGQDGVRVTIQLFEKDALLKEARTEFVKNAPSQKQLKDFIEETANDFKPLLGKVKPEVRVLQVIQDEETKKKVENIEFAERLADGNEFEISVGNLTKTLTMSLASPASLGFTLPVTASFTWYFNKHSGLMFLFFFERSDLMIFSTDYLSKTAEKSVNTFLLPGVGLTFRSLGRLSTNFTLALFLGAVNIEANDTLTYFEPDIPPGESVWCWFSWLVFKLSLNYNFTPDFSLRLNTGFLLNPLAIAASFSQFKVGYAPDGAMLQYQLLSLGAALRL